MSYIRNNKTLLLIIAVLLVTNIAMLFFYVLKKDRHGRGKGDEPRRSYMYMLLEKEAGFSPQQLAQYDSLRKKHFESLKPLFDEVRNAKDSLYQLIQNKEVSDSVISQYATRVSEKQKEVELRMFYYVRTIEKICTPEQLPKFDSVVRKVVKRPPGTGRRNDSKEKEKK